MNRVVEKNGRFYPEYYSKCFFSFFSGWNRYKEWLGCDPLGFDYGYGDVYFYDLDSTKEFIDKINSNNIKIHEC